MGPKDCVKLIENREVRPTMGDIRVEKKIMYGAKTWYEPVLVTNYVCKVCTNDIYRHVFKKYWESDIMDTLLNSPFKKLKM